jgi:hypothetical protein
LVKMKKECCGLNFVKNILNVFNIIFLVSVIMVVQLVC